MTAPKVLMVIDCAIGVVLLAMAWTVVSAVIGLGAQARFTWTWKTCSTNVCIKATLESLSDDRSHEAKLTTWGNLTYVWYREQAER